MKYVDFINSEIFRIVSQNNRIILFGQNIAAGSCLGGLCRNLKVIHPSKIMNTQNSENALVGVGFGLMLNNVSSVYFMKQLDFLLLSIDHLVNTYNIIRVRQPKASFTIMPVITDSGYEGPQSALNNLGDFCSIANIEGYSFTNKKDTETIIRRHLVNPGFRILGVSQRLLKQDILNLDIIENDENGNYFKYMEGDHATIVCFNNTLPYGLEINKKMLQNGKSTSLFSVNIYSEFDFSTIIKDVYRTRNILILDDSKSSNQLCDKFLNRVNENCELERQLIIRRKLEDYWFYPNSDELKINYQEVVQQFLQ